MRYIDLADLGIRCSVLGFGCAKLMGRVNRRQSLRALAAAYDHGINVFDTARAYGWGESEGVVGEFACGKRERVVLVTKLGILPPPRNRLREFLKPMVRGLLNVATRHRITALSRAIRTQIRQRVSPQLQRHYDLQTARSSLDTSLKALRTDYVDILFVHAPTYEQISDGKLIAFLADMIRAGKARAIGVSTDVPNTNLILEAFPSLRVVQIDNNLLNGQIDSLHRKDQLGVLTNCPFGSQALVEQLAQPTLADPEKAARWAENTDIDVRSQGGAGKLLLSYALAANPSGVVVCGMHQDEHIAENAAVADGATPPNSAFMRVVYEIRECLTKEEHKC